MALAEEVQRLAKLPRQLTLEERKLILNFVGLDSLSLFQQLADIMYNAQKPNPKTGEMYFDAETALKAIALAVKVNKSIDREPEIIQNVFIGT